MRSPLLLLALLAAAPAAAQADRTPGIGYLFPAGGCRGTEVEIVAGGQNLNNPTEVLVLGPGVKAEILKHYKPPSRGQLNQLNQKLQEYRKNNPAAPNRGGRIDPEVFKELALSLGLKELDQKGFMELGRKMRDPNYQPNPQIEESVFLKLQVAKEAPLGPVELRLRTAQGLTNPLSFHVGPWREYREQEPNDRQPDAGLGESLPAVINGQILPGDVDRFVFRAARGTRLVARVAARELMPYLADAVPGWFQATLAVYDGSGSRLAYVDDFQFDPDPALCFKVPADGDYILEIKDSIYRGREDFVYRIALGQIPFVTGLFPLGAKAGEKTEVALQGWNLPAVQVAADGREKEPGLLPLVACPTAPPRVFALDSLAELREKEPNDRPAQAQALVLPLIVNGRIGKPGDRDLFVFQGRSGERVVAEIHARRLGSPLDSLLRITDGKGKLVADSDDHIDPGAGLLTHHADSWLLCTLPADGTYHVQLQDAQGRGGEAFAYRLRLGPPRPDFELRLVPASLNARAGSAVPVTVHALRRDGFEGEIRLGLGQAPPGFHISGGVIPAGLDKVRLTLSVPGAGAAAPLELRLIGWAEIEGRRQEKHAVPCQDMMQAFIYRHLVPARSWLVQVQGRGRRGPPIHLAGPLPARIPQGGRTSVAVAELRGIALGMIELELDDGPDGIAVEKILPGPQGGASLILAADREKAKLGLKGNLIVNAFQVRMVPDPRKKGAEVRQKVPIGTLPAIPFEVVGCLL